MYHRAYIYLLRGKKVKHARNTRKCYFCDVDQKTSSQDSIFERTALEVNVLHEDTISYMRDTNLLNIVLIWKCLFC